MTKEKELITIRGNVFEIIADYRSACCAWKRAMKEGGCKYTYHPTRKYPDGHVIFIVIKPHINVPEDYILK